MANDCAYYMKIVADNKNALDRFERVMTYKDEEFYVYRVRDFQVNDRHTEGDLHVMIACGDTAWGCSPWIESAEDKEDVIKDGTAHYAPMTIVCEALGVAVEFWAEEYGVGFQEYGRIARDGTYEFASEDAFYVNWDDEESVADAKEYFGSRFDTLHHGSCFVGGFEDYEQLSSASEIWNACDL